MARTLSLPRQQPGLWCRMQSLQCRVQNVESLLQSAECRVSSAECSMQSFYCRLESAESLVQSAESRVSSAEFLLQSAESLVPFDEKFVKAKSLIFGQVDFSSWYSVFTTAAARTRSRSTTMDLPLCMQSFPLYNISCCHDNDRASRPAV